MGVFRRNLDFQSYQTRLAQTQNRHFRPIFEIFAFFGLFFQLAAKAHFHYFDSIVSTFLPPTRPENPHFYLRKLDLGRYGLLFRYREPHPRHIQTFLAIRSLTFSSLPMI